MQTRVRQGFTLIELLIVIGLVGLIAAVAAPAVFNDDEAALDRAAQELSSAFRFAHAEAIRTGQPHGVVANVSDQFVKLYRLDDTVNPPVVHYDVYDPLSKKLYDLRYETGKRPPSISTIHFKFDGLSGTRTYLGYSATTGVPKFNDSGTIRMLKTGYIDLSYGGATRRIAVSPITARVTVQ